MNNTSSFLCIGLMYSLSLFWASQAHSAPCELMRQICKEAGPHSNRCLAQERLWADKCAKEEISEKTSSRKSSSASISSQRNSGNGNNINCASNLSHIAHRLPEYSDQDLIEMRNMTLSTDLRQAYQSALDMGYKPSSAAVAALEQAEEAENAMTVAEECIWNSSANPSGTFRQLQNGSFNFGTSEINSSCAKIYVLTYYQKMANEEAAVAIACFGSG